MPEISVIMGVCNGGRFLAPAVASVQAQTFGDWELVLLENGSTDGAVDTLAAVSSRDPRIRIVRHPEPLTPGGALVAACAEARGRYLAVLDDDDLAMPRRLELQHAYLELRPEIMLLGGISELVDSEGRPLGLEPFVGASDDLYALTAYTHGLRHSTIMFRRELLAWVKYRAELMVASDWDFFSRTAEVGRIAALPEILCRYRLHPGNFSKRVALSAVNGGLVRMLTRRRRSGLEENLPYWRERFMADFDDSAARAHLTCRDIFSQEKHHDLAALHAWLSWRAGGGWRAAGCYFASAARGLRKCRGTTGALVKAWLKVPAHQLLRAGGVPDRPQF